MWSRAPARTLAERLGRAAAWYLARRARRRRRRRLLQQRGPAARVRRAARRAAEASTSSSPTARRRTAASRASPTSTSTTLPLHENRGFAHGCNAGWRRGTARRTCCSSTPTRRSTLPRSNAWSPSRTRTRASAPSRRGSSSPTATLDCSQRRFPRLRSTYAQALFLHRFFPQATWIDELVRDAGAYARPGSPEWASGACLLVRRSALERLGGLDDGFFLYCEDLDLCRRLRDAGFDVRFEPAATVVHEGGASAPRAALLPVLAASRVRYARKHQPRARRAARAARDRARRAHARGRRAAAASRRAAAGCARSARSARAAVRVGRSLVRRAGRRRSFAARSRAPRRRARAR